MTGSFSRAGLTLVEGRATLRRMKSFAGVLVIALAATVDPGSARADGIKPITIIAPGERSTHDKLVLGGIAGAGLVAGAFGLYFHRDSRAAGEDVGTNVFTGDAWTQEHQDLVDRANRSRTAAIALYGIGSACLIGAVVYWIVTDPPDETIVIQPRTAQPTIAPTPGGAVLGGMWSF